MTARRLALAAALVACALPAHGQQPAPTATWFADHPRERAALVELCRDNPGPASRSDHCAAAWQGNVIAAEREARASIGQMDWTSPTRPEYWIRRPEERAEHLRWCERITDPEAARRFMCDPAREAERRRGPARRS
jgi:hypothetical protein